ncbi:MAG TPA: tetratricopeptide repeat protein [Patescibacteria group bacterium]
MPEKEQEVSFKNLFFPFTTLKAINWIIIIGISVYFIGLFNGFIGDDWGQIVDNFTVHSIQNVFNFFLGSSFYVNGAGSFGIYYKPLMMVIYSALYTLFGQQPFFYHLTQLFLHIANSCLIFILFKRFFKIKLSFFLSLIFLIHPINSEAVYYIADMQEVLFFFFGISAFLVISKSKEIRKLFTLGILWLFSLFSKETGVLFIISSLIYNYLFVKNKYIYFVGGLSVLLYLILRISTIGIHVNTPDIFIVANGNLLDRLSSIPKVISFYITTFIYPFNITIQQNWLVKSLNFGDFYIPLVIDSIFFATISYFAAFFKRINKFFIEYLFFLSWFVLGIFLHLQIIPLDAVVSDRWFYFPIVGLLGMTGIVVTYLLPKIKKENVKRFLIVFSIVTLIIFSFKTFIRGYDFSNDFTLCSHDEKIDANNYALELCLGNEYRKLREFDIARLHLKKSISLFPKYYIAMYYLALSYSDQNNYIEAIKYFRETLSNNTWGYGADQLATLLVYHGKYQESKNIALENLKKQPKNAQLWYALSIADYMLGDKNEALNAAQEAYSLAPNTLTGGVLNAIQKNMPLKFDGK